MGFIMIKKSLYIMAVLLSTVEVNAMSLKDALQSKELSLDFNRDGTISYGYNNNDNTFQVNTNDYSFDNNTYFINMNTLPTVTNIEGSGSNNVPSILASIKGEGNISLQYLPTNSKVSDSISFSGNNSKYTGTLYLHPGINNLMFTSENSVISNINVPDTIINNGKDKDTKPFVKTNDFKLISLYLPDNSKFGKLNINGKLTVSLLNKHNKQTYLTFTEINKSSQYSLAVHDKIDLRIDKYNHSKKKLLRDINITDGSNNQKQSNNSTSIQQVVPPVSIKDQIISELKDYINSIVRNINGLKTNIGNDINTINDNITAINTTIGKDDTEGLKSKIKTIENNIGTIKTITEGESTSIVPLQKQIDTINTTIGEDDTKGLRKRIKTVEDSIGTVKTEEGGSIVPLQDQIDTINDSDTEGTLANKIKVLENKVGDTANKGELQTQIDTINSTIGKEDDSDGLKKRIKELESIDWANKILELMRNNNDFKNGIYYTLHPLVLVGNCDVKWDWNDERQHYIYSNLKCETCNNSVTCSDNTKKPSELFPLLFCNTCKYNFTAQNIQLISYLYPSNNTNKSYIELLCSNCSYNDGDGELGGNNDPHIYNINWAISWSSSNVITYYKIGSGDFNCLKCSALCVWDDDYIKGELMKIKAKYYKR